LGHCAPIWATTADPGDEGRPSPSNGRPPIQGKQNLGPAPLTNPNIHSLHSFLSLTRCKKTQGRHSPVSESKEGGAAAGPLTCARTHRLVDAPPSSGSLVGLYPHAPSHIDDRQWSYLQHRLFEMRRPWRAQAHQRWLASVCTVATSYNQRWRLPLCARERIGGGGPHGAPHRALTPTRWRWRRHRGPFSTVCAPDLWRR
jgi:hypothetical protein